MNVDEFIESNKGSRLTHNSYIEEPGFSTLYVRIGPRWLDGKIQRNVFDIARVDVVDRGKGTFTALVNRLHQQGLIVYVESVFHPRFLAHLEKMGFISLGDRAPCSCWWPIK